MVSAVSPNQQSTIKNLKFPLKWVKTSLATEGGRTEGKRLPMRTVFLYSLLLTVGLSVSWSLGGRGQASVGVPGEFGVSPILRILTKHRRALPPGPAMQETWGDQSMSALGRPQG